MNFSMEEELNSIKEGKVKEGKVKEGKVKEGKVKEGKVKEGKVKEGEEVEQLVEVKEEDKKVVIALWMRRGIKWGESMPRRI